MGCRFTELLCKEVVCLRDGCRLGFVTDLRVMVPEGSVSAIVVPGRGKYFGLLGPREDFVIPWSCVRRIGPDIILVDVKPEECRVPRGRPVFPI